jgi:6-phosphogluconolactonase
MDLRIVDDVPAAFAELVREVAPATFAISGGDLARDCYERLATTSGIDWSAVTVVVGDERWVPVDHPDSNEGMARGALLDRVGVAGVHSMRNAGDTPEAAADAYDALVARLGAIDLVHLGLGEDGHTASLFPGTPALAVSERDVVVNGDDAHDWTRLTLTYRGIARARLAVVTVAGAGKREALDWVRRGEDVPAAHVSAGQVLWLADHAAAGA